MFLGDRHGLAPRSDAGRLWVHQLQLTFADFVDEIHDTHHPIASDLYYEDLCGGDKVDHGSGGYPAAGGLKLYHL